MVKGRETQAFDDYRNSFTGDPSPEQMKILCKLIQAENAIRDSLSKERHPSLGIRVFALRIGNSTDQD
jgi:hypothetical protein